jgi:hypothetical protein
MYWLSRNPGALASWTPQGHIGLFRGYFTFYLYYVNPYQKSIWPYKDLSHHAILNLIKIHIVVLRWNMWLDGETDVTCPHAFSLCTLCRECSQYIYLLTAFDVCISNITSSTLTHCLMIGSIAECIFSTLLQRTRIIASICHRVAVSIVWTIIIRLTFWMFNS